MRLSPNSCSFPAFLSMSLLATQLSYAQAGSPGRDTAQTKAKDTAATTTADAKAKAEEAAKLKGKAYDPKNTRRIEDGSTYVPTSAAGVPKTAKVDCPPAATGGVPIPDCKEGNATETNGGAAKVPAKKP